MSFLSSLLGTTSVNLLDPAAVEANRLGRLTPAQAQWLKTAPFGVSVLGSMIGLVFLLPFLCMSVVILLFTGASDAWITLPFLSLILVVVLWQALPGAWRGWQRYWKLRSDRESGLIRQGVGELGFGKAGYVGQVGDRQLDILTRHEPGGLLPGVRYTFFYYEESGVVLSAEQLGGASEAIVRSGLNRILALANKFVPEDLDANQRGEVSAGQRGRLVRKLLGGLGLAVVFGGIGFLVVAGVFSAESLSVWPFMLIFLAVFGVIVAIGGSIALNSYLDMNAMPEVVEGLGGRHTERRSSGKSSRTVYFYDIGDVKFEVSLLAYQALLEGHIYRAYYTPRTKTLLSLEVADVSDME